MSQNFVTLDEVLELSGGDGNESFEDGNDFATKKFLLSFENIDASLLGKYNENDFVVEDDIVFNEPDTPADEYPITLITTDPSQGTVGFTSAGGKTQITQVYNNGASVVIYAVPKVGYIFDRWDLGFVDEFGETGVELEYTNPTTIKVSISSNDVACVAEAYFTQDDAGEEEEEEEEGGGSIEEEDDDEGMEEDD